MPDPPKPPPDLGSLQALRDSLELSLLLSPSGPDPPELHPVLRLPLSPTQKLRLIRGAQLLTDNLSWSPSGPPLGLDALRTALNILEKYGRNLLSPRPPRHWRAVRFGNPVFRSTVGAIQGGRDVLKLLGYTEESGEGLSFPPPPQRPHPPRVATVTADVLVLRAELDLLQANQHPNPQFFTQILLGQGGPSNLSGGPSLLSGGTTPVSGVGEGRGWACRSCTFLNPSPSVLCQVCERPRLARRPQASAATAQVWPCPRCTFLNRGPTPTCEVCGLDHVPSGDVIAEANTPTPGAIPATSGSGGVTSGSGFVTSCSVPAPSCVAISNVTTPTPAVVLVTSCSGLAPSRSETATSCSGHTPSGSEVATSCSVHAPSHDALWQRKLLEDGRRLVALVRAAESQGLPPESLGPAPFSEIPEFSDPSSDLDTQIRHFRSRLGGVLKALLDPTPNGGGASLGPLSLAEAAWAWLEGEGRLDHARCALIGRRKQQLRLLSSLGFPAPVSSQALQRHHGCHWGALRELQRLRLHPFHLRHFQGVEPGLDFNRTELQALVRQILASLPVASWGRALLVATLGRELGLGVVPHPSKEPLLVELVEAVGSCADRAALRRRLRCECAVCGWGLPRQLMQWLPGCSCPLCPECFRLHFTVGVRERGVGALGCPSCGRPDLRDEAERLWYWSTLEPQLRQCLDPDTFGLVTRKLTELELLKDPQFLWCPHCSFGFIFEAERGPAQCPQCHKQCCPRCQLPWDPRHSSLSCTDFGSWLRSRETPGPSQGLGAFLGEMGIECPQCGQCFALARGGCLHFQCSQCQHQFCAGCGVQFHQPGSCPSPQCHLRGSLHGHHPRDCLFYLRDWAPDRLQQLLTAANVAFETEPPPEAPSNPTGQCPVQEQKELGATLRDENCGRETAPGQAGLCRGHYTEYLVSLINRHGLDPAPLYTPAELRAAAQRHLAAGRSHCRPGESEAEHLLRLRRMLGEEAPIRPRPPRAICK
ncbi:E3 ubiquitin-protein ligase RNF31 isoform X2 [Oenanthe melanoleuca]|uniref:E3 ubiquitin-protein ligase RNF31 isoform X2 n=1 Tax=Oenanthe melanoleuca TaxID=2939378 RepID=UPI0024C1899F|nr:E3 ubiquitin-protein ligase RNF31 isoform X2 [Oenanthe melanoleuca]